MQLQGSKSGAPLLAVCRQINEEASKFVNDIHITRLEGGALCTAENIPAQCQSITENTRILQMPSRSFSNLHNVVLGSPFSWYVGVDCIKRRLYNEFPKVQIVQVYKDQWIMGEAERQQLENPDPVAVSRFTEAFRNNDLKVVFLKTV
jgi:hypothetical protein